MNNMNKEYRAELRDLKRNRRKVIKDNSQHTAQCGRAINRIATAIKKGHNRAFKMVNRIDKRIAILEGRLS